MLRIPPPSYCQSLARVGNFFGIHALLFLHSSLFSFLSLLSGFLFCGAPRSLPFRATWGPSTASWARTRWTQTESCTGSSLAHKQITPSKLVSSSGKFSSWQIISRAPLFLLLSRAQQLPTLPAPAPACSHCGLAWSGGGLCGPGHERDEQRRFRWTCWRGQGPRQECRAKGAGARFGQTCAISRGCVVQSAVVATPHNALSAPGPPESTASNAPP